MISEIHNAVKGRRRYKLTALYRCEALKNFLETTLARNSRIKAVSASVLTGNVLIVYDESYDSRTIFHALEKIVQEFLLHPNRAQAVRHPESDIGKKRFPTPVIPDLADESAQQWHVMEPQQVLSFLGSSLETGLSRESVEASTNKYGINSVPEAEVRSKLEIFLDQFKSLPVALLGVAAGISVLTAGIVDAAVIAAVVGINGIVGYYTESRAEETIRALRHFVQPSAKVLREGVVTEIAAGDVVVGDILVLKPGTYVVADARVVHSNNLSLDESILTGESMPVMKTAEALQQTDTALGDRVNMIYGGTLVTGGLGMAIVVAVGPVTEIGRIQSLVATSAPPETPIERQLEQIGNQLVVLSGIVCGVVFFIGLLRGNSFIQMLKSSISLAVAAVPEGLPTVATTTLALGVGSMRQHQVLVRNLEAVCTLGSVETLCFDKTGTVTVNEMSVVRVYSGNRHVLVSDGTLFIGDTPIGDDMPEDVLKLVHICALCNESEVIRENGTYIVNGTSTENALIHLAIACGVDVQELRGRHPILNTRHRAEDRQFMTTLHEDHGDRYLLALKGSPLEVLHKCRYVFRDGCLAELTEEDQELIEAENDSMAGDALRVLGAGFVLQGPDEDSDEDQAFAWLGLVGMADPVRRGVKECVQVFHQAGLETVMITGDQSQTAYAVGRQLGLANGNPLEILDSSHLNTADPKVINALVKKAHVFARVSPSNKLQIVQALQNAGKIVAMTGDGINDGPALKAADVGIAMGRGGTDVAREVADVILEEDNLETLIIAVRDGRTIYLNIRKALHYLLATNFSEIQLMFTATALGLSHPLNAMQLLWINLISDVFPGLALAMDPPEADIMDQPPRDPEESIVKMEDFKRITAESAVMTASSLAAYAYGFMRYGAGMQAGTMAFQSLTGAQILHALNCRSETRSIFDDENQPNRYLNTAVIVSVGLQAATQLVPGLRSLLGLAPLTLMDGIVATAAATVPLFINNAMKKGR
jgi:Ca2+-transporting ATPase